jgi:hypothetical protein
MDTRGSKRKTALKEDLKAKLDDEDVDGDDETEKSSGLLAV